MSFAFPTDHEDVGNVSVVCRLSLEVLSFPLRVSASVVSRTTQALAARGEYPLAYRADSFGPSWGPSAAAASGAEAGAAGGEGAGAGEGKPSSSSSGWKFAVSLRDCGEADFLVSERRYNESVARKWRPNERVMMEWKEEGGGERGCPEAVLRRRLQDRAREGPVRDLAQLSVGLPDDQVGHGRLDEHTGAVGAEAGERRGRSPSQKPMCASF